MGGGLSERHPLKIHQNHPLHFKLKALRDWHSWWKDGSSGYLISNSPTPLEATSLSNDMAHETAHVCHRAESLGTWVEQLIATSRIQEEKDAVSPRTEVRRIEGIVYVRNQFDSSAHPLWYCISPVPGLPSQTWLFLPHQTTHLQWNQWNSLRFQSEEATVSARWVTSGFRRLFPKARALIFSSCMLSPPI